MGRKQVLKALALTIDLVNQVSNVSKYFTIQGLFMKQVLNLCISMTKLTKLQLWQEQMRCASIQPINIRTNEKNDVSNKCHQSSQIKFNEAPSDINTTLDGSTYPG